MPFMIFICNSLERNLFLIVDDFVVGIVNYFKLIFVFAVNVVHRIKPFDASLNIILLELP